MSVFAEIYKTVKRIPRGKVASYGQVASALGNPRLSRVVGYALHANPSPGEIPCHRVVNRHGRLAPAFAFGGEEVQRSLLEADGVVFEKDGSVNMKLYCCDIAELINGIDGTEVVL